MVQTAMARAVASTFIRRVDGMLKGAARVRATTLANLCPYWEYRRITVYEALVQGGMVCVSGRVSSD